MFFFLWDIITHSIYKYGSLTNYIKLWVAHASGMPRTFPPPPRVSDPAMHHGACVTHVQWCLPVSLTSYFLKNVPGIRGACATRIVMYLARGPWWIYSLIGNIPDVNDIEEYVIPLSRWHDALWCVKHFCLVEICDQVVQAIHVDGFWGNDFKQSLWSWKRVNILRFFFFLFKKHRNTFTCSIILLHSNC